jgi:hypothetical protein
MTQPVLRFDASLGQRTRVGTWEELAVGTYQAIRDAVASQQWAAAADLIGVTIDEASELRDIFAAWPGEIIDWINDHDADPTELARSQDRLAEVLHAEYGKQYDIDVEWAAYVELTESAADACRGRDAEEVLNAVERARLRWQRAHDYGVDELYGLLDCAVRMCGEDALGDVWNHLMRDWYDDHARRLDIRTQPWAEAAEELMTAIVHGFHGHLSGTDRLGGMTYLEDGDRVGFRFDPCGSGGRTLRDDTTDGKPRPAVPFALAVTERPHDWSWNKTGVQAYCVHCCLLNMVVPIDRLGYPTRVVEPPTWPDARSAGTCTWWVYKDPALIPDEVYARVGRSRPDSLTEHTELGHDSTGEDIA